MSLSLKDREKMNLKVGDIVASLTALGGILEHQHDDPCYDSEELYSLGKLLKWLSKELSKVKDGLGGDQDWYLDYEEEEETYEEEEDKEKKERGT